MLKSSMHHIGIFGKRNAGKSSFINSISGQDIAIVSAVPGTTTDPVSKTYEITGLGPVVLIDTAGIDDEGELGEKRIAKTLKTLREIDFALLLFSHNDFSNYELNLISELKNLDIPYLLIHSKEDEEILSDDLFQRLSSEFVSPLKHSSKTNEFNSLVIETIKNKLPKTVAPATVFQDLIDKNDLVLLVTPIDEAAPEGRLILPQVQSIRDLLDRHAITMAVQVEELDYVLNDLQIKPKLVVTDSQAFKAVSSKVPDSIMLTSFSILFSRLKGDFQSFVMGTPSIRDLEDGDRILMLESCSHTVTCEDIGRIKLPRILQNFTQKKLEFDFVAGLSDLPRPVTDYKLLIQCGGCMLTRAQVMSKLKPALNFDIPITNYGMAISFCNGIFDRALKPFKD